MRTFATIGLTRLIRIHGYYIRSAIELPLLVERPSLQPFLILHQAQFALSTCLKIVDADVFQFLHEHKVKEYSRLQIRWGNNYWRAFSSNAFLFLLKERQI